MLSASAIIALIVHYGYAIIFPVAILEGPLVSILGGFLVSQGLLSGVVVFIVLLLGDWFGDTLYYCMGKYGGRKLAHRWGTYIGVDEEKIGKLEKHFDTHDWKLIFFSKTQAIGGAILFSAGLARMSYRRFITLNIIGSIPKIIFFMAIGYYFGDSITQAEGKYLNYASAGSFLIALLLICGYFLFRSKIRKKEKRYTG